MTKTEARRLAEKMLKREPNESFYIMKLHGIEDIDTTGQLLTSDSPYDVIRERDIDFVLGDMSADQVLIRTIEVIE